MIGRQEKLYRNSLVRASVITVGHAMECALTWKLDSSAKL